MSVSTIGWIAAGVLVAVSAALVTRRRTMPRYGQKQTYSVFARALMGGAAMLFLVGVPLVVAQHPPQNLQGWIGYAGCMIIGVGLLVGFIYYLRFWAVVMPDAIKLNVPFRGTFYITKQNLISASDSSFKGAKTTRFTFQDAGRVRTVTLAHRVVALTAIFYRTEIDALNMVRTYVDTHARNRRAYSVNEGRSSDGLSIEVFHGRGVVSSYDQGRRVFEATVPNSVDAMILFLKFVDRYEGSGGHPNTIDLVNASFPAPESAI